MSKIKNGGLDQLVLDPSNGGNLEQLALKGLMHEVIIDTDTLQYCYTFTQYNEIWIISANLNDNKSVFQSIEGASHANVF